MTASRRPPPLTAAGLEEAALNYLGRYASSAANLRRVLLARIRRAADPEGEPGPGPDEVEALIGRFLRAGLLDDTAFALTKTRSLRRRGASAQAIRDRLLGQGIDIETIKSSLKENDAEPGPEAERAAALALCRRRRLGPFRNVNDRARLRDKDLAALARAGFRFEIAASVVGADGDATDADEA
ncbi:MAG: hypothetical protein GC191_03235 [Azospirillum sp.]|nr:hypothetical protein [Azospirillum sp.]